MRLGRLAPPWPASAWTALLVCATYGAFAIDLGDFRTTRTMSDILANSATDGLLAVALTIPLIAGEIDLSIGSNLALSGVVFVTLQPQHGIVLAAAGGIASGTAIGLVNSVLVCRVRANSFVATLAMLYLAQSVALVIAHGDSVAGTAIQLSLDMSDQLLGPITIPFLILAAVTLASALFVGLAAAGRDLVAIGGNRQAARLAGIAIERRLLLAFVLSGTIAGIAGVQLAATTLNGAPASGGADLLTAATSVFLGGVSLTGGRGSPLASVLAVIALSTLKVGLQLAGISSGIQNIVTGTALVAVILARALSIHARDETLLPGYLGFLTSRRGPAAAGER